MKDFLWEEDADEKRVNRIRKLEKLWAKEDDDRRRRRAALIALEIEDAKRKQTIEDARDELKRERDAEIERRRNYYLTDNERTKDAMTKLIAKYEDELNAEHIKRLKKLAQITEQVRKDKLRAERKALLEKGVLRGRRR
jgi:hypothetical protein